MKRLVRSHKKRRPHLFLSHSSQDDVFSQRLARNLGSLGIDVWIDNWELEAGDNLEDIMDALRKSRFVGVLVSPDSAESSWVRKELSQALAREKRERKKTVVPLLYKKGVTPRWATQRVYVQFRGRYFPALAELGGMMHGFGRQRIAEAVAGSRLRSTAQIAALFEELGWDGAELIDSHDFDVLAPLRGIRVTGNIIDFYPEKVLRMNHLLPRRARVLLRNALRTD